MAITTDFERDSRRKQEIKMRPAADGIYRHVFGKGIEIKRYERKDDIVLNIRFAIDVEVRLASGMILTGQEKFLSNKYASFRSVTVEYLQNRTERGDWFKLAAQFYMTGYITEDWRGFDPWMMIDWPAVVIATEKGLIRWSSNANKDGHAQASFRYCDMLDIPRECVISSSWRT